MYEIGDDEQSEEEHVSCPGVWLCQDGRVSLTVFALGTSYQTCLLPPVFPIMFKDVFYFRKRFKQNCALNNVCCLLKDETIYCELVQWTEDCETGPYVVLAQYLGSLNDVLFPPNMCWSDGVDLLMRRCRDFPGILAPKIEILTKMRIQDEVTDFADCSDNVQLDHPRTCGCRSNTCKYNEEGRRQKAVCHSPMYHSYRHNMPPCETKEYRQKQRAHVHKTPSGTSCPSMSPCGDKSRRYRCRSPGISESISLPDQTIDCDCKGCSLSIIEDAGATVDRSIYPIPECLEEDIDDEDESSSKYDQLCAPCPPAPRVPRARSCSPHQQAVYTVQTHDQSTFHGLTETGVGMEEDAAEEEELFPSTDLTSPSISKCRSYQQDYEVYSVHSSDVEDIKDLISKERSERAHTHCPCPASDEDKQSKILLESRFIESPTLHARSNYAGHHHKSRTKVASKRCVCEICKRYHELFHTDEVNW